MVDSMDRLGQKFGEYRLLRWLGGGGYGDVYLAEHIRDHTQVAIKILNARLTQHKDLEAFINEARTIRLKHPYIVPLLDFGIGNNDLSFLVMEYAPLGTLRERHPKGSRLPISTVVDYVAPIASALQYAHDLHLVHRDVKPENILVGATGEILLSDFGIATAAHNTISSNTQKELEGTIPYMAPEQLKGKPRPASDQYSLGIVVYEWLCGRRPFEGAAIEVAQQHTTEPPPSLRKQLPMLSRKVEQVVLQALAKDPKARFASIQLFAIELAAASQQQEISVPSIKLTDADKVVANEMHEPQTPDTSSPIGPISSPYITSHAADSSDHFGLASPYQAAPLEPDTSLPVSSHRITSQALDTSDPFGPVPLQPATLQKPDTPLLVKPVSSPPITPPTTPTVQPPPVVAHPGVKKSMVVLSVALVLLLVISVLIYTTYGKPVAKQSSTSMPTATQTDHTGAGQTPVTGKIPTPFVPSSAATGAPTGTPGSTAASKASATNVAATSTPTNVAAATPTSLPQTTYAVDGQDPTTYTVNGQTCAATLSHTYTHLIVLGDVTGTLYFEFSATCQAAWAEVAFNNLLSAGDGHARIVRSSDGGAYTCDVGASTVTTLGKKSCYTAMVHDGSTETASAYASYTFASGQTDQSAALGPY